MRRETVFIVGATGFVGSHLTARLLKEGRRVIALVQPKSGIAPHRRLNDIIAHIDPSVRTSRENLIVIPGSIRRPPASWLKHVRNMGIHHIDAVWNLAVLFNVSQGKKQEVKEVNIQGVQHILEFVSQVNNRIKSGSPTNGTSAETIANPPRYYHVSTAYSSGKGPGPVTENIKTKNLAFHSLYDWSKHAGECLVKQYRQKHDLDAVIFRPSIVVCARHSNIINCTAYYKVVEVLYNLRKRAENALGKNFDGNIDVRMWAAPKAYLNIVPLDFVVNAMSIISQKPAPLSKALQIFNIVNESPPSIETVHRILCKSLSIKDFRLVSKDAFVKNPMNPVERLFDRRITFQAPYARESVTFNCEKFRQAVSYSQLPIPQTGAGFLQDINKNFLAYHMRKLLSN